MSASQEEPARGSVVEFAPVHGGSSADHRNEVRLVGRVSGAPERRVLPSGDEVVTLRIVVQRGGRPRTPRSPRVDTIECSAWTAQTRRRVARWADSDVVEVRGALRRRFRRAEGGPVSRYEVEIAHARRVAR